MVFDGIILTQYTGKILGPIAKFLLGPLMNGIFYLLDKIGIPNIGLAIIIFTIVMNMVLLPLTYKQQKFSKLSIKMNPELQAIQAKYKDRKDNDSMMAMNNETKMVYAKYGASPSGSCVYLLIQMPIMFALYRVIYSLPAYIHILKEQFQIIADNIIGNNAIIEEIKALKTSVSYVKNFDIEGNTTNAIIDCLNSMNVSNLEKYSLIGNSSACLEAFEKIKHYNYFLGMNLSNSPLDMIRDGWANADGRQWGLILVAIIIPILAGVTQWLNVKLMPQQDTAKKTDGSDTAASMAQSMKLMNNFMPIMSIVFCFNFSAGVGIYWIAGSVIRTVQQIIINKRLDKIDLDELIEKNLEKRKQKMLKKGIDPSKVDKYAKFNTKNIAAAPAQAKPRRSMNEKASIKGVSKKEQEAALKDSVDNNSSGKKYAAGSLAAKANLVSEYNNRKDEQ